MNILSIQSSVSFGHVGNEAARLPLAALGHASWMINSVAFSNHPGYGRWQGRVTPADEIAALLGGLGDLGLFARTDALLTGYLGEAATADVLAEADIAIRAVRPDLVYLCDPVLGDVTAAGEGRLFVPVPVARAIEARLLPLADIVTPNVFELGHLTGQTIDSRPALLAAAARLRGRLRGAGDRIVLVTGYAGPDVAADGIETLAVAGDQAWCVVSPRLDRRFDGAGDCFAALFLGHYLPGRDLRAALEAAVSALQPILAATEDPRHLAILPCLDTIRHPPLRYPARAI